MKLSRLIDSRFHALLRKINGEPVPLKTAFKLRGIKKRIEEELEKYEVVRKEALAKYGIKNEDGTTKVDEEGHVQFDEEGMKAFGTQLSDLLSIEVEIPTLSISELNDTLRLSSTDLDTLDGFLVE